jgi:hypothetical protein
MNSPRPEDQSPSPGWRRATGERGRVMAHWLVVAAAVGYLAWVSPGLAADVARAITPLDHLRWDWLAVTGLCGVAALVVYSELHRQLLLVGGARVAVARLVTGPELTAHRSSMDDPLGPPVPGAPPRAGYQIPFMA